MKGEKRKGIQEYDFEEYTERRMLLVEEGKETKKKKLRQFFLFSKTVWQIYNYNI